LFHLYFLILWGELHDIKEKLRKLVSVSRVFMDGKLSRLIKSRNDPERYGWSGHFRWPLMSIVAWSQPGPFFEEL
jgi:hypothetical protein